MRILRTIYCNDRDANSLAKFKVRRVANLYFLMISILSWTSMSPVSPLTNVVSLSLVLIISLVKETFEDDVLIGEKWESIPWKRLQVGDIVRVKQDGFSPADILFLASTNPDGVCYIEVKYNANRLIIRCIPSLGTSFFRSKHYLFP